MSDSDKKTFLFVGLAIVVIFVLMKYLKPAGATQPIIVGQPPAGGGSAPSPTGFNPYLTQGPAAGPSPGGAQPSDTAQWLQFGSSLAQSLGTLGGQLIQTYGGSNDSGSDSYDYEGGY